MSKTVSSAKINPASDYRHFWFMIVYLISGCLFGVGLMISGMSNPHKVIGFLDVVGDWDPSLMFVMIGAIAVAAPVFWWRRNQNKSLLQYPVELPAKTKVDRRLIIGAIIFGTGWGLAGVCPGPALVLLSSGMYQIPIFLIAMLGAMWLYEKKLSQ